MPTNVETRMAATKLKERPGSRAGGAGSVGYDEDFYTWTQQQATALRAGRLAELDIEHLAEEIESLGKEQFSKLESSLRLILLHMSKWDRQPQLRSRSWALTIERERRRYEVVLRNNPGLKPRREEALREAYEDARLGAIDETGLPRAAFPKDNPYELDEALTRPIEWPEP